MALFLSQTAFSVDMMGTCLYTFRCSMLFHDIRLAGHLSQVLNPEDMDEFNRTPCSQNTRRNVMTGGMDWIGEDSDEAKKIWWICSLVATGKGTLFTMTTH